MKVVYICFNTINILQNKIPVPISLIFLFSGYPHYSKLLLYSHSNYIQLQSSLYIYVHVYIVLML